MRKFGLPAACIAAGALIAGCGGGGGGSSRVVTRTVAGFVYVLGSTGSASPDAVVLPTAVAPAGFFAPTSGSVTLSVPDGTITRAPDNETFNMNPNDGGSNAIICAVKADEETDITVSGNGLNYLGSGRSFNSFAVDIGLRSDTGTVLLLNTGTSVYTPGPVASIKFTIDGLVPTNPVYTFIAGHPDYVLAVIGLDASGVIVPGTTFNVSATDPGVTPSPGSGAGPFSLTPANTATPEGPTDVIIDTVGANVQGYIDGTFSHGTVTSILVSSVAASIWWNTTTSSLVPDTTNVTATVNNQFGVAMPGKPVTFSTNKIPANGNDWNAVNGSLAGTAFALQSGDTLPYGQRTTAFTPPNDKDAVLTGTETNPKGVNIITATSGSVTGTVNVTILRPVGSLTIAGDLAIDTGNTGIAYNITGALDVDGATADIPSGGVVWNLVNTIAGPSLVGNTGDQSARSVSTSSTNGSGTGTVLVGAGPTAGQFTLLASIGAVDSNTLTVDVYGVPSKLIYVPNTDPEAFPGASGAYYFFGAGTIFPVTFTFHDSFGHTVGSGGNGGTATWQYTGNIDSATGGSLVPGSGLNNSAFTITSGPGNGLFTITTQGNWSGANGGSGPFNIQRSAGHLQD